MQKGLPTPGWSNYFFFCIRRGADKASHTAASTELFATLHQEMVSPMYLPSSNDGNTAVGLGAGGYRDSQEYDADGNVGLTIPIHPSFLFPSGF